MTEATAAVPGAALRQAASEPPFEPARGLGNAHLQTIVANQMPRTVPAPSPPALRQRWTLPTGDGDRLRVHWWERPEPGGPVLVVLHGLTGSAEAANVLGTAAKAYLTGFEVVRVDLRNATGDVPSVGVGHAGRSEDLLAVLEHVRARRPGVPVAVIGFSLGGNIALKAAGELGGREAVGGRAASGGIGGGEPRGGHGGGAAAENLAAVAALSVPIDLDRSCAAIDRPRNWIYRRYFLRRMAENYGARARRHPDVYRGVRIRGIRTIREWDDTVVAPVCGFASAEDYYARCSSLPLLDRVRVPTLLLQARDDPFVPFEPFADPRLRRNPWIRLEAPARGGHLGFLARRLPGEPDRFWAENRAVAFCAAAVGLPWPAP